MSKNYNDICNNILQSNKNLYTESSLIQEFACINKEIKKLSSKVDQIYKLLLNMNNRNDY